MKNQIVITLPTIENTLKSDLEKKVADWKETVNVGKRTFRETYQSFKKSAEEFCKDTNEKLGTDFFSVALPNNNTVGTLFINGQNGLNIVWKFDIHEEHFFNNMDGLPSYYRFLSNHVNIKYEQRNAYQPTATELTETNFFECVSIQIAKDIFVNS